MGRSISIALALVLAGGLIVCSGGGDKQAVTKVSGVATTEGTTKTMEQRNTGGMAKDVTTTVFHYMAQTTKQKGLEMVEEAFAGEHPEYQITWDNVFYDQGIDYPPQLRTALAFGDQPEVVMGNPGLYPDLVTESYAADLTDNAVIKGLDLPFEDLGDMPHDGKIYGFPIDFKTWDTSYNREIFVDNGIEESKTYTKFLTACERLSTVGIDPWAHVSDDAVFGDIEMRNYTWTKALEADDKGLFGRSMSGEEKPADYPYFEKGLDLWAKRLAWMRDDAMTNDQNAVLKVSISDEAAVTYSGTWGIDDLESMIEEKDSEYGLFTGLIDDKGSAKLNVQADQSFMLNPQTESYDVTLEFTEYWVQNGDDSWSVIPLMPLSNGNAASNAPEVVRIPVKLKASGGTSHYDDPMVSFNSQLTSAWRTYLIVFAKSYSSGMKQNAKQRLDDIQTKFDQIIAGQ